MKVSISKHCKHLQSRARHRKQTPCSPGVMNKVDSIYISAPWFRLTLMDLASRLLFHRFRTIYCRMKTKLSLVTGTYQQLQSNTAVCTQVNTLKPKRLKVRKVNEALKRIQTHDITELNSLMYVICYYRKHGNDRGMIEGREGRLTKELF